MYVFNFKYMYKVLSKSSETKPVCNKIFFEDWPPSIKKLFDQHTASEYFPLLEGSLEVLFLST